MFLSELINTDASSGLSEEAALNRLDQFGPNVLPEKKPQSVIIRFLKHFNDILIYILLFSAVITFILGHLLDTIVIVAVAVINATIGFYQEGKAARALEGIRNLLSLKAKVVRDGRRLDMAATDLVVGDLVLLRPGDKVPADLRLVRVSNLKVEESALTGESVSSDKNIEVLDCDTVLGNRSNMAFSGTTISSGTGAGIVVAVGKDTELGKINQMLADVKPIMTPLLQQTAQFGRTVSYTILAVALFVYLFGYFFRDYDARELLLSVIGLAVAAIPEGLPAILSIILAKGVQHMARNNAIIRNLPSVETLGSVSVICSDKTGTLTKNEMTVQEVALWNRSVEVTGTGYAPEGTLTEHAQPIDINADAALERLLLTGYICNDTSVEPDEKGVWGIRGEPTEGALITLFHKSQRTPPLFNRIATIPFDSRYKYMATLVELNDNTKVIYVKGAPDRLLEMATYQCEGNGEAPLDKSYWERRISLLAGKGQRTLAAAYLPVSSTLSEISQEQLGDGLVFIGLVGIIDPPREEAIEAIRLCREAGITVKMITGDHVETAMAIGKMMGISEQEEALQGLNIEAMNDEELTDAALHYNIFARTSPEHKLRLVNALQRKGIICAMTGDGVNDAPALKQANVGIAMGIKGTEVTKDASEIVLADDNFYSIEKAVEEGRRVYDNLKKTILFVLPTNGAESFLIIASILFGTLIPLTPIQIFWVNMVTSVTVSFALAFEDLEPQAMQKPPRSPKTPLLSRYFIWRILLVSLLIGGSSFWINVYLHERGLPEDLVRTVTLQTIVVSQLFHLFNNRSVRGPAFNAQFFSNRAIWVVAITLIALQLLICYVPFMHSIFGTASMPFRFWFYPIVVGIGVFILIELEKAFFRYRDAKRNRTTVY